MTQSESPPTLSTAHQHAAKADDYVVQGLISLAAEEHHHAAEAYLAMISKSDRSHGESAKRTLRRLYNEHCKASKELFLRAEELKAEGTEILEPQRAETVDREQGTPPDNVDAGLSGIGDAYVEAHPDMGSGPMTDSQRSREAPFMLYGGQQSVPGDALNQFWDIMQGVLENLSQRTASATAPFGISDIPPSVPNADVGISHGEGGNLKSELSHHMKGSMGSSHLFDEDDDLGFFSDGDDELSGTFLVIPGGPETVRTVPKTTDEISKEEFALMKRRLAATERVLKLRVEQDLQLRDILVMATQEAQRATSALHGGGQQSGPPLDFSSLKMTIPAARPITRISAGREAQYLRRISELEEDLDLIRGENEKNKLKIEQFRERWGKLKESSKRKKEAKAAAAKVAAAVERDHVSGAEILTRLPATE